MSKADYSKFDAELIRLIGIGKNTMMQLDGNRALLDMAKPFCDSSKSPYGTPEWRIIDRRLQALRKAGKITYSAKTWSVV